MSSTFQELPDNCVRAITRDGSFRIITVATTQTCQGVVQAQGVAGNTARLLSQLVSGAILLREAMAPEERLQAILKQPGRGSLVADTHPGGMTRGLAQLHEGQDIAFGAETLLAVMRVLDNGQLHQGMVDTEQASTISDAFCGYLQGSEQVYSILVVGSLVQEGQVEVAGGYLIQLLPGAHVDMLEAITARAAGLPPIEDLLRATSADPAMILAVVMGEELAYKVIGQDPVHFGCHCSTERMLGAMATLSRADLEELMADELLELGCDYCGKSYALTRQQLRELLS